MLFVYFLASKEKDHSVKCGQIICDEVQKMVLDWMAWKKEKATVGHLTKALYLNTEC